MIRRFIFLAILMMLHSFAWNEYAFAQDKHQESQNPVIGVILPFSSAFKGIALEQQKAVNIALDKYRQGYDVIFKDDDRRKELVFKIQEIYAHEVPAVSLYYPNSYAAFNPDKGIEWFYTRGGISKGIPIPQNKMSLIR